MSTDDDDALSWAGDESPDPRGTLAGRPSRTRGREPDDIDSAGAGEPSDDGRIDQEARDDKQQLGSVALVLVGLLFGVHLLYAVGWALSIEALQTAYRPLDSLGGVMFSLGLVFAIVSPLVWFVASFWFTRSRPTWTRIAAIAAGAILLVPWPFLVGMR